MGIVLCGTFREKYGTHRSFFSVAEDSSFLTFGL